MIERRDPDDVLREIVATVAVPAEEQGETSGDARGGAAGDARDGA